VSRRRYTELLANYDSADADLPALREARAAVAAVPADAAPQAARAPFIAAIALTGAIVAMVVVALGVRRKKRGPVTRAPRTLSAKRIRKNRRGRQDRRDHQI
jgi:hypothetical protein